MSNYDFIEISIYSTGLNNPKSANARNLVNSLVHNITVVEEAKDTWGRTADLGNSLKLNFSRYQHSFDSPSIIIDNSRKTTPIIRRFSRYTSSSRQFIHRVEAELREGGEDAHHIVSIPHHIAPIIDKESKKLGMPRTSYCNLLLILYAHLLENKFDKK